PTADHPAPASAGGCAVQIVELTDSRRAPETLGSLANFRSIQAPPDREAWLRSIFEVGMAARGFKVSFAPAGAEAAPGAVTARIRLQAVWISTPAMNKAGSAVLRMNAAPSGAPLGPERVYRGDQTGLNWAGSTSEFNGLLDRVFADALDAMAADLRPLCPSGSSSAPPPPTATP
ncbi:MAG: hypothetical protein ACHP84_21030, partial [Caulobacterales bacterium]